MKLAGEPGEPKYERHDLPDDVGSASPIGHAGAAMLHSAITPEGSTAPRRSPRVVVPEDTPLPASANENPVQPVGVEPGSESSPAAAGGGGGDIPIDPQPPTPGDFEPEPDDLWAEFDEVVNQPDYGAEIIDPEDALDDAPYDLAPDERHIYLSTAGSEAQTRPADPDVRTSLHKVGDSLVFGNSSADGDPTASFEVTGKSWSGLGLGEAPNADLVGTLHGSNSSDTGDNTQVKLLGSGDGQSSVSPGIVSSDKAPHFERPDGSQFALDGYGYRTTQRPTDKYGYPEVEEREAGDLARDAYTPVAMYEPCFQQVDKIVHDLPSIDFRSREPQSPHSVYSDEKTEVTGRATATSNGFTVLDVSTGSWVDVERTDRDKDEMLKVSIADLDPGQSDQVFMAGMSSVEALKATGAAVTTYTSSDYLGVDAITYRPALQDAVEQLGLPPNSNGTAYVPEFRVLDGAIQITNASQCDAFRADPTLQARITRAVNYTVYPTNDGGIARVLSVGDKDIILPDPVHALRKANPLRP